MVMQNDHQELFGVCSSGVRRFRIWLIMMIIIEAIRRNLGVNLLTLKHMILHTCILRVSLKQIKVMAIETDIADIVTITETVLTAIATDTEMFKAELRSQQASLADLYALFV